MRKLFAYWRIGLLLPLIGAVGCGLFSGDDRCKDIDSFEQLYQGRGEAIAATCQGSEGGDELAAKFLLIGIARPPEHEVDVYRLTYETIDPNGDPTMASASIAVPGELSVPARLVAYLHGTEIKRDEAPSFTSEEKDVGVVYAGLGYLAILPDYLGLGVDDTRLHPYNHAASEASATVDALRAARTLFASLGLEDTGELFLTGYSQGGHAAMATHRDVEQNYSDEFTIVASAPGAGPYDMSGTMLDFVLDDNVHPNPYYFPYVLLGYNSIYELVEDDGDFFAGELKQTLPPLYDGMTPAQAINDVLPDSPLQAMDPNYAQAVQDDPNHPLRVALRDNDVYDWTPMAPIRLYQCSGDEDVMPENADVAFAKLQQNGANVDLLDPVPGGDHSDCVLPTLIGAQEWFDTF